MLTQCPQCNTVFRLRPEQLDAAGGKVRCGQCHSVFDATQHLIEEQAPEQRESRTPPPPTRAETATIPAPEPARAVEPAESVEPMEAVAAEEADDFSFHLDQLFNDTSSGPVPTPAPVPAPDEPFGEDQIETLLTPDEANAHEPELPWHQEEAPPVQIEIPDDSVTADDLTHLVIDENEDAVAEFDLPDPELTTASPLATGARETLAPPLLGDTPDVRRGSSGWSTLGWTFAILLLLAALVGQYAYLNSADLVQYPQLRPALELLCRYSGCSLPPRRDVKDITLLERDIRSSDKYQGVLVITATLVNRAPFAQPYPDVEVSMRDLSGNVVASRLFRPREYLAGGLPRTLFASQATAQLELRVADPGADAVGFEFTFY